MTVPAIVTTTASNNFVTQSTSSANMMNDEGETGVANIGARDVKDMIRSVECRVKGLEDKTIKLTSVIRELNDLMKKHCKNSFTIRGSSFEVGYTHVVICNNGCCGHILIGST